MNKIISILLIAIALVAGLFVGMNYDNWSLFSEQKTLVSNYPDLDLSPCSRVSVSKQDLQARKQCYDSQLITYAVAHQSLGACGDISNDLISQDCKARINRLQNLSDHEKAFCDGVTTDALCIDLANFLVAQELNSVSKCANISGTDLQQLCLGQLQTGLVNSNLPNPPAQEVNKETGLIKPQFGLVCLPGDEACLSAAAVIAEAVRTADLNLCDNAGQFFGICQTEVALRQSLSAGNTVPCEEFKPAEVCLIDLTIAQALEAEDSSLCDALSEVAGQACRDTVNSADQKRFDYAL